MALLVPGETEEAVLRPHPLAWAGRFGAALVPAAWGAFCAWLLRTSWWTAPKDPRWWQIWEHLYGNTASAVAVAAFGMVVAGAAAAWLTRTWPWPAGYGMAAAVAAASAALGPADNAIPLGLAGASLALVGVVEAMRRRTSTTVTTLRLVHREGLLRGRERQMRLESVTDLDVEQGPLGRLLDVGTLVPVLDPGATGQEALRLDGLHPFSEQRARLERLVHEASSAPYLRKHLELERAKRP